ncbi:hypothetical protein RJP21_30115 [Paenibacillus sp. VCA1]|uniref:hypothetical protein n=1 Tax=Paenibacillus sp. VCA1 TaxID=3039148 RepID=UPI00287267BD|nr:hypothetical protein [Paenibacillus sp. VCA1]MDR9857852.1 hypothetical protein [Paenibacillus sp. VCA1]
MNPKAVQMIENALDPLIRSGCRIERLNLVVCPAAEIAQHQTVRTRYGQIRVKPDGFVRKGLSYIIEDPGRKGRGFAWVSGYKAQ